MYTERFSLSFVCGVLLAAAERRRPGLGAFTEATREALRESFRSELAEIRARFFELFDDAAYWERLEKTLTGDVFERYCAAAEKQTQLERRDYGVWRGGDLVARGAYMAGGLAFGLFMVYAPFIPVPREWDFLILLSMLGAPFLPDLQVSLHKRRYARVLGQIVMDMKTAEAAQALYAPLGPAKEVGADGPAMVESDAHAPVRSGRESA